MFGHAVRARTSARSLQVEGSDWILLLLTFNTKSACETTPPFAESACEQAAPGTLIRHCQVHMHGHATTQPAGVPIKDVQTNSIVQTWIVNTSCRHHYAQAML